MNAQWIWPMVSLALGLFSLAGLLTGIPWIGKRKFKTLQEEDDWHRKCRIDGLLLLFTGVGQLILLERPIPGVETGTVVAALPLIAVVLDVLINRRLAEQRGDAK